MMVTLEKDREKVFEEPVCVILPYQKQGEFYVEDLGEIPPRPVFAFLKRAMDVVAASVALVLLLLPMLLIAVGIKLSSKGTVFFTQDRVGLNGKPINIIKFRTMCMDAEANGAQWCSGESDERIFPFGRFLRKTRMDELPQFWCILKGDLSLVGPRPERECFYKEFETYIHGFRERLKVKPGLTGLAQVNGGYDLKPEEKIVYDVEYIKNRSLWLDVKIMFKTVAVVLTQHGAK
jgi:lipopolysaccharide/colanic/teichoic acid biosynthesis glycosyltransferase